MPSGKQLARRTYNDRYRRKGRGGPKAWQSWTNKDLDYIALKNNDGTYVHSALDCSAHLGRSVNAIERARWRIRQGKP